MSGAAPVAVRVAEDAEGAGARAKRVRAALADEARTHFTERSDREAVCALYGAFCTAASNALAGGSTLGSVKASYSGEWRAGKQEGRGSCKFAHGDQYEGEWRRGRKEGKGTYRYADGRVFEGEFTADRPGKGTCAYADGRVGVMSLGPDGQHEGAVWSADRR